MPNTKLCTTLAPHTCPFGFCISTVFLPRVFYLLVTVRTDDIRVNEEILNLSPYKIASSSAPAC